MKEVPVYYYVLGVGGHVLHVLYIDETLDHRVVLEGILSDHNAILILPD
jgi:hypothetical protein